MIRRFVSYPKSGRTWLRYGFTLLDVVDQITFSHDGFEFNRPERPPHDFGFADRLAAYLAEGPIVYLSRDPRDVLVSLYFQVTGRFAARFNYAGDLSDFIRDEYFGADPLLRFRTAWSEAVAAGQALQVTYEDCHRDFAAVMTRIAGRLQLSTETWDLEQVAAQCEFQRMRDVETADSFPHGWLRPMNDSLKVRRGVVGGFGDYLSVEDQAYLVQVFGLDRD